MKTRRDESILKAKLEEVENAAYNKSLRESNRVAFTLAIVMILSGLFGGLVLGPWLSSL